MVDVAAARGEVGANESSSIGESRFAIKTEGLESTSGSPSDLGRTAVCAMCAGVDSHVLCTNVEVKHAKGVKLETTSMSNTTTCRVMRSSVFAGTSSPSCMS